MKVYKLILVTLIIVLIVVMTGCEYDGPTAMYNQKRAHTIPPVITKLNPEKEVLAGVNYITIEGENFSEDIDNNKVYIDGYQAEIIKNSSTSIKIRRPNRSGDSTTVKVNVFGAVELAVHKPYKIDLVYSAYGSFLSGDELGVLVIDKEENAYLIENNATHYIYKVTPDGEKTIIGTSQGTCFDAALDPNGNLIIFLNNREIYYLDIQNGVDTVAVWVNVGRRTKFGDFDNFGNLYTTGARRTDLIVVNPDHSSRQLGLYPSDEIFWICVCEDYVYVLVRLASFDEANPEWAIWRHVILDADGNLGNRELVLDWSKTGEFAESTPTTFAIANDGNIYIGADYVHPIMFFNPNNGNMDIIYKDILPSRAQKLVWGNGNYLYMVHRGDNWNLIRIDMGSPDNRDFGG